MRWRGKMGRSCDTGALGLKRSGSKPFAGCRQGVDHQFSSLGVDKRLFTIQLRRRSAQTDDHRHPA